jgi:sec-independent protein translocase protein TatA
MGMQEWLIVAFLVLVLFGAKKIPELARSVGQAVGEVQKGIRESQRVIQDTAREPVEEAPKVAVETKTD